TGELMGIVVAALGVWWALASGRRRTGAAIAALGFGWTVLALRVVVPHFSGGDSIFYGAYDEIGGSPFGVGRAVFTHPTRLVAAATEGHDLLFVVALAAPLAGLFVLAPLLAAVAAPQLAANLLANHSHTTDPHVHYIAPILPFLFAAVALG